MPDEPTPAEPLQTVTDGTMRLLLTADEAELWHRFQHGGDVAPEARTALRALAELGTLRYRLERMGPPVAEAQATDPRARLQELLDHALTDAESYPPGEGFPTQPVRDLALALAALGGPTTPPVETGPDPVHGAARVLAKVLQRFTADDFQGRLEDLVAPLNDLSVAVKLQA